MSTGISLTPRIDIRSFLVPTRHAASPFSYDATHLFAIIPTYAPSEITLKLVRDLILWNERIIVYVVDDCSPQDHSERARLFQKIAAVSYHRVRILRTPENKLKAGALNHALAHIEANAPSPDVILTLDDDVVIERHTVKNLVCALLASDSLGAVCSQCRVFNKNVNLLTRLQGLEYLGFNAIRLADEGFFHGPLVMHGMLTAFRGSALRAVGGFLEGHLIEDYEVTTRLKEAGWSVKSAPNAPAWTVVPEKLSQLWRQRTRWSYGGITVVARAVRPSAVIQDILGHFVFLSTLLMVVVLLFSKGSGLVPPLIAEIIIAISLLQLLIWYGFQLWLMRHYSEKDTRDWLIRLSLVPEFMYSYLQTAALLGSYVFHIFASLKRRNRGERSRLATMGTRLFRALGYSERSWGTRAKRSL